MLSPQRVDGAVFVHAAIPEVGALVAASQRPSATIVLYSPSLSCEDHAPRGGALMTGAKRARNFESAWALLVTSRRYDLLADSVRPGLLRLK